MALSPFTTPPKETWLGLASLRKTIKYFHFTYCWSPCGAIVSHKMMYNNKLTHWQTMAIQWSLEPLFSQGQYFLVHWSWEKKKTQWYSAMYWYILIALATNLKIQVDRDLWNITDYISTVVLHMYRTYDRAKLSICSSGTCVWSCRSMSISVVSRVIPTVLRMM